MLRHGDEGESDASGIEDRAELFLAGDPGSVRFIDDDRLSRTANGLLRSSGATGTGMIMTLRIEL
jgi:hypothetical protein